MPSSWSWDGTGVKSEQYWRVENLKSFDDFLAWLHRARPLPEEEFKREVERELTGKETEPWEIIYFNTDRSKISKSITNSFAAIRVMTAKKI
jgi:hypothetical protein